MEPVAATAATAAPSVKLKCTQGERKCRNYPMYRHTDADTRAAPDMCKGCWKDLCKEEKGEWKVVKPHGLSGRRPVVPPPNHGRQWNSEDVKLLISVMSVESPKLLVSYVPFLSPATKPISADSHYCSAFRVGRPR
jgi:hypothetical protein